MYRQTSRWVRFLSILFLGSFSIWASLQSCTGPAPYEEVTMDGSTSVETTTETTNEAIQESGPSESIQETMAEQGSEPLSELSQEPSPEVVAEQSPDTTESSPEAEPGEEANAVEELTPVEEANVEAAPESAQESTPEQTVCKQVGETLDPTTEQCCSGLSQQKLSLPFDCSTSWSRMICLKCGDGVCDYSKGEDLCSCPTDCANPRPTGTCTPQTTYPWTCPTGKKVRWCDCTSPSKVCMPECRYIGTRSEGWYNSCDGKRYKWEFCSKCKGKPVCDKMGSKSEGWYCDGNLIAYAQCSQLQGSWSCIKSPENGCGSVCQSDNDCGKQLCQQRGEDCVELSPYCNSKVFNRCDFRKTYHRLKTCRTQTGQCQ